MGGPTLPGMEFIMPKDAAIKNAARARQEQTGETYAEARAAVVAEHDKPIHVELWYAGRVDLVLDTPEARKMWRELPTTDDGEIDMPFDPDGVSDFAAQYLPDDIPGLVHNDLEYEWFERGTALREAPGRVVDLDVLEDARWVSEETGTTVTPEQVEYLVERYGIPDSEQFCDGPDLHMVIKVLPSLPDDMTTPAILARYASALADADPAGVYLLGVVRRGFTNGNPVNQQDGVGHLPEVERINAIMECATAAGDGAVLHECVNALAAWMHKLADWSVQQ